jgi:glycosyltransferase involved in cell wall biosynthesis
MSVVVGIDASRNRSGGAKGHLAGILGNSDPVAHGVSEVHVWSYRALLDALPDRRWLVKHNPPALERSLFHQGRWQFRELEREAEEAGCDVLLSAAAGTLSSFRPAVLMSRNMLPFEPGERERYGLSMARARLNLLRIVEARSLRRAAGAIFLTQHAARVVQQKTGPLQHVAVIPHGVGDEFRRQGGARETIGPRENIPFRCLYVSNVAMYKHQWEVVRAVAMLRERGHDLTLVLAGAGGGSSPAQALLDAEIARLDPEGQFVEITGAVPYRELPALMAAADLFVFASSCENMPITLVEAMASGLPIASSDRGPMPELLGDGGIYFDPEDADSIAAAVESIMTDPQLAHMLAVRASKAAAEFSWARCGRETWEFLRTVAEGSGMPSR